MSRQILGLYGSVATASTTGALVRSVTERAGGLHARPHSVIGLADFGPSLGSAQTLDALAPEALALVARIVEAEALVIGAPVYKGSYPGLFKHLFDLLDPASLAGKPVLLVATGGGEKHALVVEHQLRPLLGFFEAATLPTGLYASAVDLEAGRPVAAPLLARIDRAVAQFAPHLTPVPTRELAATAA